MKRLITVGLLALNLLAISAQAAAPDRNVKGGSVYSTHDPAVRMDLPASAAYVGGDRWILEAYADDVELHAFVDADKTKQVRRLYWIQFEAYLPTRPELKHTYDSPRHTSLGGMDFFVDSWTESTPANDDMDSDSAHLKALLAAKGYALPASTMSVRFVHVMDGARKELMFIYSEPVPAGLSAGDLKKGGKAYAQWPAIEKGLIERGEKSIQFHQGTHGG